MSIPSDRKCQKLWDLCEIFIEEQEIRCAESVHQTDRVSENALGLIEAICEIVGYHKDLE